MHYVENDHDNDACEEPMELNDIYKGLSDDEICMKEAEEGDEDLSYDLIPDKKALQDEPPQRSGRD